MRSFRHARPLRLLPLASGLLVLAGCKVGPNFQKPDLTMPASFRHQGANASPASIANLPWWKVYNDSTLRRLIGTALDNNHDLRIAASRVEQARQAAAQTRSAYWPSVDLSGGISRGRNQAGGSPTFTNGATGDDAALVLGAVWELDVWGRVRRLDEASRARYFASEEGRSAVVLSLVSDVAQAYFELLELDLELSIATRTADSFRQTTKIFDQRREGGVASKLETSRAEAALAQAAAAAPDIERRIAQTENRLSILLGGAPSGIKRSSVLSDNLVPANVPAGLPADLLERRPDLRASEQNLRAANAEIGVAMAEFYPKIGLTVAFGRVSPSLESFRSGRGNTWSLAANATGPIFEGGRLNAQLKQARARWEEASISHQQAVLQALGEVSNALVARQKLASVRVEQTRAVEALNSAVEVATQRYIAGKASYYEVIEAQQQRYPAETALAQTKLAQLLAVVQLYKALGGGWTSDRMK